jgi:hypothetical protein
VKIEAKQDSLHTTNGLLELRNDASQSSSR